MSVPLERPALTTPMMSQSLWERQPLRRAAVTSFVMLPMLQDQCVPESRPEYLGNRLLSVLQLCVSSHAFAVQALAGACRHWTFLERVELSPPELTGAVLVAQVVSQVSDWPTV